MNPDALMDEEQSGQDELYEHFRITVDRGQSPVRLDRFLQQRIQNASRTKIQHAAEAGNIVVNGKMARSSYQVKPGDEIAVLLASPPRETEIIPENIPLDIIFEDDQVLVVNKPAGMVVHPAYGNYSGTLVNALAWHLKDNPLFQEKSIRPGLVHRIDKNTSGLLLIAKDEVSLQRLAKQFFDHKTERRYMALVWGNFDTDEGTITGNIGRSIRDRKKMDVFDDGLQGKPAITHYKVMERFGYTTLVECRLETGRTHQIRVHFQHIKHPVFNDEEYGGNAILRGTTSSHYKQFIHHCFEIIPRHALHARSLGFTHPVTRQNLYFEAPIPADFSEVLERWRNLTSSRQS